MTNIPPWMTSPGVGLITRTSEHTVSSGFVRAFRQPELAPLAYPADMEFRLPNCGLVACAIAANVPLGHAKQWFKQYGNWGGTGYKGNWKGRTLHIRYSAFLNSRWIKHVKEKHSGRASVARFVRDYCRPGRLYMIRIRGHVMVAKDGWVCDQYEIARADAHKNKRGRVLETWEIL